MTSLRKIAASLTCVAVISGATILWSAHKRKTAERKLAEAARVIRARAGQGEADAQYSLGNSHRKGEGVPRDYAESVRWYRKAADRGEAKAQYALGCMSYYGQGAPQDYTEAVRWYRKAAAQGDVRALNGLAYMHDHGQGVPQDHAEAVRWNRKAAERGDATAQSYVGFCYFRGQGVPQDHAEAVRWYRKAGEQGDKTAQVALTIIYFKGQGVPRNYTEAIRWFGKGLASCFARQGGPAARWTSIVGILLGLLILAVPRRLWGHAAWPSALTSAGCAVMLAHEMLLSPSFAARLAQKPLGIIYTGFGRVLFLALLAGGSVIFAIGAVRAVRVAVRGSKRGGDQGQPTTPREGILEIHT
jgi:hypothetical protein